MVRHPLSTKFQSVSMINLCGFEKITDSKNGGNKKTP